MWVCKRDDYRPHYAVASCHAGCNIALDHDCWRGIEDLMIANRKDLARLYAMANGEQEEGGAR
jgi:hypothetical protein